MRNLVTRIPMIRILMIPMIPMIIPFVILIKILTLLPTVEKIICFFVITVVIVSAVRRRHFVGVTQNRRGDA